jgi:hypothetical protein
MDKVKIAWNHDQFGRYAVIKGWLRLAVSKSSRDGKFFCLIDGCSLPIGDRNPQMFDEESQACDFLVGAAVSILGETKTAIHEDL